ncbi:MAG TPA: radical SAM protein [Candidatus Limnocylindrales bacterium]|nr:radical SAM protein [Candidatus Limnocylindrales bacterium]
MLALRPYTPLRMVLTVCGHCFSDDPDREIDYATDILQGNLVSMDGKVYLRRTCRRGHGEVTSLYEEDADLWASLQQWRVPTREIVPDRPGNAAPIPMGYADGLGDLQTQHSCVLLLDITENCNLSCPTCFAASGPGVGRFARLPHILASLDTAIAREGGRVDVLMLSGGEPTVHPEVLEIIEAATQRNVTRVVLNTNGIRIARDDRFVAALGRLRRKVEVYLQFDGFELSTHLYHRGEDLRAVKQEAIRRLGDQRVFTTLACAVAEGVNDAEVGAVAEYALATDFIAGVAFQPVFGSGRANPIDPMRRVTTTGTLVRLGEQTAGRVASDDFIALPCSHPDCSSITYFIRGDGGDWRSVPKLLGPERLREGLGLVSNRIAPDDAMWTALVGLMSETTLVSRPELIDHVLQICDACDLGVTGFVKSLGRWMFDRDAAVEEIALRVKRFSVKSFMDAWTMNVERLQQCCVHVGSTDGGDPVRVPFCARQAFGALRRRTSAGMVSARELVDLDAVRRPLPVVPS